ncbi:unnamed protein product [Lepeophtheirus salmonis]|uniref:(salmon louse) hypothetical protein n=1 Tax=Lepeophtheirus salmonis TaxID=72036 RepID=A0A7R8HCK7_LEPSM|nr:unnamed protein product [Lepeophtheirus salmonis]CAF3006918.1 unnamed protein product [Lepeophtheirus salmonis]
MVRKLSLEDCKNIILCDETPFPLFWISNNNQVGRIWTRDRENVIPVETVKKSQGITVWGATSASGFSDLHIIPQSFRLTAHIYGSDTLEGPLEPILGRAKSTGLIASRKLVHRRSGGIFNTMVLLPSLLQQ